MTEQTDNMCVTDGLHTTPIAASFLRSTSCLRLYFLFERKASVAETDVVPVMRMVCKIPGVRHYKISLSLILLSAAKTRILDNGQTARLPRYSSYPWKCGMQ